MSVYVGNPQQGLTSRREHILNYAVPGALGSTFLSLGSTGVGWYPLSSELLKNSVVQFAQTTALGQSLARAFVVVGAALLLQAWLVVGIDALHGLIPHTRTIFGIMAAWSLPLVTSIPLFSRDVYSYFMQGNLLVNGLDPYHSGVSVLPNWIDSGVDPLWGEARTPYGPIFLLIEQTVASATTNPLTASFIFKVVNVCAVFGLAAGIRRLAIQHGLDSVAAMWLAVLNPLIFMHFIAGIHNDALMVTGLIWAFTWALDRRLVVSSLALAMAIGVKPIALVAIPFIGYALIRNDSTWSKRIQSVAVVTSLSSGPLVLMALVRGLSPLGWISALTTPTAVVSWLSPFSSLGMLWADALRLLGLGEHMDQAVTISRGIGTLLLVIALLRLVFKPEGRAATRSAALACGSLIFFGPVVQPWYLLWAIPLFACTGLTHRQLRITVIAISLFTIHGIANSSATSDTFIDFSDGVAMFVAAVIIGVAVLTSKRERVLVIGDSSESALIPETLGGIELFAERIIRQPETSGVISRS